MNPARVQFPTPLARFVIAALTLTLVQMLAGEQALAQTASEELVDLADTAEEAGEQLVEKAEEEEGAPVSRVIVPIPISNPLLGTGLGVAAGWFYKPAGSASPWATGIGALATENGSWGLVGYHKMALAGDRLRLEGAIGTGRLKTTFRPSGLGLSEAQPNIELTQDAVFFEVKATTQILPNILAGAKVVYSTENQILVPNGALVDGLEIRDEPFPINVEYDVERFSYGPALTFDTTDGGFNKRSGVLVDADWLFTDASIFNDFGYNQIQITASEYFEVGNASVIALRQSLCLSSDNTPFFAQCDIGTRSNLRGYPVGVRNDDASWAAQAEWRVPLSGKFGAVAFAGVGSVANGFDDFGNAELLPAGGVGLRYLLAEEYGVNFRVDYALGKDGSSVYISIGEAF